MKKILYCFLILITLTACNNDDSDEFDRSVYEGANPWGFIDGSDPSLPIWDNDIHGWVPHPADNRPQITIDNTFSVPVGETFTFNNVIVWVKSTERANMEISGILNIIDSLLLWDQTEHRQAVLSIEDGGTLFIKNSASFDHNGFGVNWEFQDGSTVYYNHFVGDPWTGMWGNVHYTAVNFSTVEVSFLPMTSNAVVVINDAHNIYFEIMLPYNTTIDMTFPRHYSWINWNLNGIWPDTLIDITDSYMRACDISIDTGVKVTIRDAIDGFCTGWMVANEGPGYIDAEITGLGEPGNSSGVYYADKTWSVPQTDSYLRVINSVLRAAWPNALGYVHLVVRDSNLWDPRNFGTSVTTYEIYNSAIRNYSGYSGSQSYLENCEIETDIEAKDAGTNVYAYNLTDPDDSPFQVYEIDGGSYIELSTPGIPW